MRGETLEGMRPIPNVVVEPPLLIETRSDSGKENMAETSGIPAICRQPVGDHSVIMRLLLIPLLAICPLVAEPAFRIQPDPPRLLSPAINEASGLAVSPSDDGFLWLVNDSGGTPEVHLVATDGTARGSVMIDAANRDWEDLAAFTLDGKPHLLIADVGDNGSSHKRVTLHIVREPVLPAAGKSLTGKVSTAWKIEFTFEDGPRDCEAVAVDAAARKIILISKRTEPSVVYELPLRPGKHPVARRIGTTAALASGVKLPFGRQPTGMDISADNRLAAVVSYLGVFLFKRSPEQTWAEAFGEKPEFLGPHGLKQAESVAFSPDGRTIFAVSEKVNSPIIRFAAAE
jgi:hypothetical protein